MAAGTFATYQGIPLRACTFNRGRGWSASTSTVEVLASQAKPFSVADVPPPDVFRSQVRGQKDANPERRFADVIDAGGGELYMAEEARDGTRWEVRVGPLYVIRTEVVKKAHGGDVERVRLTLADGRYFWPRGVMERWSFNRVRADGSLAKDSTKSEKDAKDLGGAVGDLFTRYEVATIATRGLPGAPKLVAAPERWRLDKGPIEFPRFPAAVESLHSLVAKAGLEDPCLRLDGSVAFHAAADGKSGYASSPGGANDKDFPAPDPLKSQTKDGPAPGSGSAGAVAGFVGGVVLSKDGTGRGRAVDVGYPEEFVVVVGGERIVSVAVDDWEPVLVLPGSRIVPLNEETVRLLTDGAFGIEWLKRFVLLPTAYQNNPKLDPEVGDLLADQAWRMFRLPGAEVETPAEDGGTVRNPGPNAHLLPLLPRAECVSGRRLAPTVECFHFTTEHVELRGSPAQLALAELLRQIAKLKESAPARVGAASLINPLPGLSANDVLGPEGEEIRAQGVTIHEIQQMLTRVRQIQSYRKSRTGPAGSGEEFADRLLSLTRQQIAAEEQNGAPAGRADLFDAAVAIWNAEEKLRAEAGFVESLTAKNLKDLLNKREGERAALAQVVLDLAKKANQARAEARRRIQTTGTSATGEAFGLVLLSNRPKRGTRKEDQGARVVDAEAGIVRTSQLAGHVDPDGCPDPLDAKFVPRPVRVIFGAVLRPRLDVAPGVEAPKTGTSEFPSDPSKAGGGENVIPSALSDQETYYTAAFQRVARGNPIKVQLSSVVFDRAVRIYERDFVELVPLDGRSNAHELDQRAANLVAERMNVPDQVETTRLVLARPWPVQCDGVVSSVTIVMREKDGAPCGFETIIQTGSSASEVQPQGATRERPRMRRGGDGAKRGGAS